MNALSRTMTGITAIILGIFLIGLSFFKGFFILFYAAPIFIIGIFIFFNKKEDEIEKIKRPKN